MFNVLGCSQVKNLQYSPFLFDELYKQNLLFPSLSMWAFMPQPMFVVFGNVSDKGKLIIVEVDDVCFFPGFCGTVARDNCCVGIAIKWNISFFSMLFNIHIINKHAFQWLFLCSGIKQKYFLFISSFGP